MQNTISVNNRFWQNATISEKHVLEFDCTWSPELQSGIWFDGTWTYGVWNGGSWMKGTWIEGHIHISESSKSYHSFNISPKSFLKPNLTLSLNYARYG